MKKKLIMGAILAGGIALLAIIIASIIVMLKGGSESNITQGSSDEVSREAIASFRENKFDEALSSVDNNLVNNSEDIELLLIKADILLAKGSAQFEEEKYALRAQEILNKVLKMDAKNVKAFRLMGYSYEIQNLFNEALINYNKSLAIRETPDAYNWKGHTYDLMGEILKAEEFYKKAVELEENYQMALRNLSRVYLRIGKKDEARKILEKLIQMPVDNISLVAGDYHSLGTIEFEDKNIDKAKELFEAALEIDPTFMLAQVEMAKYKILFDGERDEAISILMNVVQDYPKQVAPMEWLGFAYLESDKFDQAIDTLNKATELTYEDITLMGEQRILIRSRLNYYLSMAYSLNGDIDKAKEYLLKIMEGTDKNTMTMLSFSLSQELNGPYKNLMSDSDIKDLAKQLKNLNK
jgi:tetratricopeptide (TPR) repeat protein